MNKGERLIGASEKIYMQGSINSVTVKPILCHEHESNVALPLFATDDRLKLKKDDMLRLFAKTGEVYVVYEFGWNDKTKVCLVKIRLRFECMRAKSNQVSKPTLGRSRSGKQKLCSVKEIISRTKIHSFI